MTALDALFVLELWRIAAALFVCSMLGCGVWILVSCSHCVLTKNKEKDKDSLFTLLKIIENGQKIHCSDIALPLFAEEASDEGEEHVERVE